MIYKIVLGDESGDGHSQTSIYTVEVSHTKQQILDAYAKSASKTGVEFFDEVCAEHEDIFPMESTIDDLKKHGIIVDEEKWKDDGYLAYIDLLFDFKILWSTTFDQILNLTGILTNVFS